MVHAYMIAGEWENPEVKMRLKKGKSDTMELSATEPKCAKLICTDWKNAQRVPERNEKNILALGHVRSSVLYIRVCYLYFKIFRKMKL